METLKTAILEKVDNTILQYELDFAWQRYNIKIMSLIEFKNKWGNWSEVVLDILDRKKSLKVDI